MFSVVSAHLSAQSMNIVGFVCLLFYRYWRADKNTVTGSSWPTVEWLWAENSLTGYKLSPDEIFYRF